MNILLGTAILIIPGLVLMGIARLVGIKNPWGLSIAAILGSVGAGVFITSAASAMASAVDNTAAAWRGVGFGLLAGLVIAVIYWGIRSAKNKTSHD